MQIPKFALVFFCLVIFVTGEPQPEPDDSLGEFQRNSYELAGRVHKNNGNLLIEDFTYKGNNLCFLIGMRLKLSTKLRRIIWR